MKIFLFIYEKEKKVVKGKKIIVNEKACKENIYPFSIIFVFL
jgi:hypothetical protein